MMNVARCPYRLLVLLVLLARAAFCAADNVEVYYNNFVESSARNKVGAANRFFQELADIDYADTLYHYAAGANLHEVSALVHYWMAEYYYGQAQYDPSIAAGEKALTAVGHLRNDSLTSDVNSVLGIAYFRKGYFDIALDYFLKGYEIDRRLGDNERLSSDLNNIASIYLAIRQPDAGITYIRRAIDLERKLNRPDRMAIRLGMASELYLTKKDHEQALEMARRAYDLDTRGGRHAKAAVRLSQMAAVLIEMKRYDEAQSALSTAIARLEQDGPKSSLAICYRLQGKLYLDRGNHSQAVRYFSRALEMSREMGNKFEEREDERGLWKALEPMDAKASLNHLERYSVLADSMFKAESARQLSMFRAKYRTEELARENELISARNRWVLTVAVLLTLLLLAALLAAIYALRQKSRAGRLAREVESLRTGFVSNITNEFRNPLSVIMGIGNQMKAHPDAAERNNGDVIVRQCEALMGLVNELIGASRMTSAPDEPDWRKGDMVAYLRMIVDNYHDLSASKSVTLAFKPADNSVTMDFVPDYVSRMMHNLLTNAITFTPHGGTVEVTTAVEQASLRIAVSDTGCGIPAAEQPHIFDAFYRGRNAADLPGFGMGLSLVKNMVTSMSGTVEVDSVEGRGTTVAVSLPMEQQGVESRPFVSQPRAERAEEPQPDTDGGDRAPLPIALIVENHTDMAYYTGNQLHRDYKVFYARSGEEGFEKAQDLIPDLVITTQQMPGMSGYDLCRMIRSTDSVSHVPLLMVASLDSNEDRIKGIEAGADAYLVKPFNGEELLSLAGQLMRRRQALREKYTTSIDTTAGAPADRQSSRTDQEFLNKLVNLIHSQMSKGDIDMDTIGTALGMSRKQLRSRVQNLTGESPSAYVLRVRMGKAKRLVRTTGDSIGEVAAKCGFQDVAHFSRAFKQFFGVTPSQYRKNVD